MKTCLPVFLALLFLLSCDKSDIEATQPDSVEERRNERPNVLFIVVDDLNDYVGALDGHPQVHTPNIDRLSEEGVLFTNAHTAAPLCNPSRVAVFTGMDPRSSKVYDNDVNFRDIYPDLKTLPELLKESGYQTMGSGKINHGPYPDPQSWNYFYPSLEQQRPDDIPTTFEPKNGFSELDWGLIEGEEQDMSDYQVANWVIDELGKDHDSPFFLSAGIYLPHPKWYLPERLFSKYTSMDLEVPKGFYENDLLDVPEKANPLTRIHDKITSSGKWNEALAAYLGSIEFADEQIGRILSALASSTYAENTIVVLWSDHGWQLGEKKHWKKGRLWERCSRVPVIIKSPWNSSFNYDMPVNLLDIYPTILDLLNVPFPDHTLDGHSLVPILNDSSYVRTQPSITTFKEGNYSVRDNVYRYITYDDGSEELYHMLDDPYEWTNLANIDDYDSIKTRLRSYL